MIIYNEKALKLYIDADSIYQSLVTYLKSGVYDNVQISNKTDKELLSYFHVDQIIVKRENCKTEDQKAILNESDNEEFVLMRVDIAPEKDVKDCVNELSRDINVLNKLNRLPSMKGLDEEMVALTVRELKKILLKKVSKFITKI